MIISSYSYLMGPAHPYYEPILLRDEPNAIFIPKRSYKQAKATTKRRKRRKR